MSKICKPEVQDDSEENKEEEPEKKLIFLQYRGKATENFERALRRINAPCKICLLYTSPSPRDATLSRMPSSA